jgi:phosphosulfolactate synthase (CoM biosynthesis protein A)
LKHLGFDVVEISTGFLSLPPDNWLRLVDRVHSAGLIAKPEIGIQFGAGGDTAAADLESMGTSDPSKVVNLGRRFITEAGVERIMVENEGITENVKEPLHSDPPVGTDVPTFADLCLWIAHPSRR